MKATLKIGVVDREVKSPRNIDLLKLDTPTKSYDFSLILILITRQFEVVTLGLTFD